MLSLCEVGAGGERVVESRVESALLRPLLSGLYSATVMWSWKVTKCGVWAVEAWILLLRRDESEWTPFSTLECSVCVCV